MIPRTRPWRVASFFAQISVSVLMLLSTARADETVKICRNDAAELTVSAARVTDHYGPIQSPEGRKFLVLSTEWRNLLGSTLVKDKLLVTPYLVPELDKQLFVIADGAHIAPMAESVQGRPGCLPIKDFKVPDPLTAVRGNLVFDIPADAHDLLLAFIDERYRPMSAQLVGAAMTIPPRTEKNEIVEAFVANQRVIEEKSTAETQTIAIDVRLRSIFQPDRKARTGKVVSIPDWQSRYVQAIADGAYAGALVSGPFDANATMLPEVFLGGEFVFRVPAHRSALNVMLYFGEMGTPAGKVRPRAISLAVKLPGDAATARPAPRTAVSTRDAIFDVAIVGVTAADQFGNAKAPDGKRFLIIDATITNISRQPEFFQCLEQLKHVAESGEFTSADDASLSGSHPPAAELFIPNGEKRSFQMVYAIPVAETRPRIGYASPTEGGSKVLTLPVLKAPGQ